MSMKVCHHCNRELHVGGRVGRDEICPFCRSDLRCCRNCTLYDASASNQCREPQSEWVGDREKANFCEHFTFRDGPATAQSEDPAQAAKRRFDDLFKK
jgi:hypothetical protein